MRIWYSQTGQQLHILKGHNGGVTSIAYTSLDQILVSGSSDGTIKFWNTANGQLARTLSDTPGQITDIAISDDGRWLASGRADGFVRLWDFSRGLAHFAQSAEQNVPVPFSKFGHLTRLKIRPLPARFDRLSGIQVRSAKSHSRRMGGSPSAWEVRRLGFGICGRVTF